MVNMSQMRCDKCGCSATTDNWIAQSFDGTRETCERCNNNRIPQEHLDRVASILALNTWENRNAAKRDPSLKENADIAAGKNEAAAKALGCLDKYNYMCSLLAI